MTDRPIIVAAVNALPALLDLASSAPSNGLPAVCVPRPTIWGNPFRVGDPVCRFHAPREKVRTDGAIDLRPKMTRGAMTRRRKGMTAAECVERFRKAAPAYFTARDLLGLRGKNLACWCALDAPCHADVLLELANRPICEAVG